MNPRQLNVDLQFCGNPISKVIPETLNYFTLQKKKKKKCISVSGCCKQKEQFTINNAKTSQSHIHYKRS